MRNKQIHLQTRAIITQSGIHASLERAGYAFKEKVYISDTIYASHISLDPTHHTYEKYGTSMRIRTKSKTETQKPNDIVQVQEHTAEIYDNEKPRHDIYSKETIEEFTVKNRTEAIEKVISLGYPYELTTIAKLREIYTKGNYSIHLDTIFDTEPPITILEIESIVSNVDQHDEYTQKHQGELTLLGIHTSQIIDDGYVHRRISQEIGNNPEVRKRLLEADLERTIKRLREKEKVSGEAFRDTGDGWHENPTYETIYHDILALNKRLIDIKEELATLKGVH